MSKSKVRERKMSRLSLKEVLASILNSDDESDDFSQLDSASQARGRGRPGGWRCFSLLWRTIFFLNTLANLIKMVTTEATTATGWNSLST